MNGDLSECGTKRHLIFSHACIVDRFGSERAILMLGSASRFNAHEFNYINRREELERMVVFDWVSEWKIIGW